MNRATSFQRDAETESGQTVAQLLNFKTEEEVMRVGGSIKDWRDMQAASSRVLRANPALAKAYFENPNADRQEVADHE